MSLHNTRVKLSAGMRFLCNRTLLSGMLALCATACGSHPIEEGASLQPADASDEASAAPAADASVLNMNEISTGYVKLVLMLGQHDPDYVDAYYGPAEWKAEAAKHPQNLKQIEEQAQELIAALATADAGADSADPQLLALRKSYLKNQLGSLTARARLLQGEKMSFDDEARALYDVEPPHYSEQDFAPVLKIMDGLLPPGPGTLAQRYNQYIEQFAVPTARLESVMRTAIGVAQFRTAAHLALPAGERFDLAFVTGKPWSAYNWYQGNYVSRIEVNTDLPIPVSRVIELAAHEGYPGHHVYNSLLEHALVRGRGWPEYQVYALFSPQSFIAEGSADFGVGMIFPGNDRLAFTRELFQLSGFDPKQAANYLQVVDAAKALAPAGIEGARRYIDGEMGADALVAWLQKFTLASPARAKQRLAFINRYRSYIINYSYGEELVRDFVEREGDKTAGSSKQWQAFATLLSTPRTPTALRDGTLLPLLPSPASTSIAISTPDASGTEPPHSTSLKMAATTSHVEKPTVTPGNPKTKSASAKQARSASAKTVARKKSASKPTARSAAKTSLESTADFKHFIAGKPTPEQFHKRYPSVSLILFGAASGKEARSDGKRFFAQLDRRGRIVGGKFR